MSVENEPWIGDQSRKSWRSIHSRFVVGRSFGDDLRTTAKQNLVPPRPASLSSMMTYKVQQTANIERLSREVKALSVRLAALEAVGHSSHAAISSFAPEPYEVKKPIPVAICPSGEEYTASFLEANISTSGETEQRAYDNLRELILDTFDNLSAWPTEKLGPEPKRHLAVLREFINDPNRDKGTS